LKLVKEHINEFKQGGDPYKTMGLGVWTPDRWISKVENIIKDIFNQDIKFGEQAAQDWREPPEDTLVYCNIYFDTIDEDMLFFFENDKWALECNFGPNYTGKLNDFSQLTMLLQKLYDKKGPEIKERYEQW
jgi:hypothetical protein